MTTDLEALAGALAAVLNREVGRQTLCRLGDGQGTETEQGKAWLRASALLAAHEASSSGQQWPTSRDTARLEDMSPNGHLRVSLDNCGDAIVEVFDGENVAHVEFCTGAGGGGKSPRTRQALIVLMVAIGEVYT